MGKMKHTISITVVWIIQALFLFCTEAVSPAFVAPVQQCSATLRVRSKIYTASLLPSPTERIWKSGERRTTLSALHASAKVKKEYNNNNNIETKKNELIGDDAAYFSFKDEKLDEWIQFTLATGAVLAFCSYVWFLPSGPHLGDSFLNFLQRNLIHSTSPDVTMLAMLTVFAVAHSGLAALRSSAEDVVGPRAWRVVFAIVSLPLALSCLSYFVNHCHEGIHLWNVTHVAGVHALCFVANFVSFLLLYPSTFNLLEVAAIQKPQLHLWGTGIARITRHPQAMGQILWCVAHTLWLGTSTSLAASVVLIGHHLFSIWHGDRRLHERHGEAFDRIREQTSVIPFQAILEKRQILPDDYYKEFVRGPYALVIGGTLAAYYAHPFMMAGAALLNW